MTRFVAIISGLDLGSSCDKLLDVQEMVYALMGKSGIPEIQKTMAEISKLIIAGEIFSVKNLVQIYLLKMVTRRKFVKLGDSRS